MKQFQVDVISLYKSPIIVEANSAEEAKSKVTIMGFKAGNKQPDEFLSLQHSDLWSVKELEQKGTAVDNHLNDEEDVKEVALALQNGSINTFPKEAKPQQIDYAKSERQTIGSILNLKQQNSDIDMPNAREMVDEEYDINIIATLDNEKVMAKINGVVAFPDSDTVIPLNVGEKWHVIITGISKEGRTLFFHPLRSLDNLNENEARRFAYMDKIKGA